MAVRLRGESTTQSIRVWRHPGFNGITFHRGCHATHPYPRHWHDELHLCAYTEGAGYLRCRGTTRLACAGDLVLTPPSEVHDNWVVDGAVSFVSMYITRSITAPVLSMVPSLSRPTFYLVGSGAMIKDVKAGLQALGIERKRQIRNEAFFD